ncbi:MAG: 23S rRNA (guanosine(2251)-2'-O)-methyltransferase RlmB [Anaerolineae bacterium]|jgi:23S rRNA (guanosine2251-2'-O)-methyltransferase|nr:23S rRNA (guanosine(2251)-2'-O)-methyltransferase RlmB [Anaerolineae bacterium]MBT3713256.1 23S rRNA (guanosine(2251)-2'-O)-methyltransferase RlmB [Anaerolineae bacterium]MBT4312549.1 23S rRNA (guanosine(2251)-2'-O)-methyltransferase RlmB [Anaerolineae bacterium]MBT4457672.1 23S rRNA (guanosine(2251)-2'-O)-methyltransferase RlmB [Anaerolineae bacterium]MBT4841167.1 23S rRNA (guanosine(2251)-2'-O)-methyltransferase RlmB [Anaerolineae bacterium]
MKEFIYGRNPVYETLRAKRRQFFQLLVSENAKEQGRLAEIIQMARAQKVKVLRAPRNRMDKIAHNNQGIALEVSDYPYHNVLDIVDKAESREEPLFVLILDTLQDPQNFGTLLRTAESVGVHGVIIPLARTAQVSAAVVNASSGASEHLLIAQANLAQAIRELKDAGAWIIGLEGSEQAQSPGAIRLDGGIGIVVGSEGHGMRRLTRESCDLLMKLPMQGEIESLNAAVAGSVALYLAYLEREKKK